MATSIPIIPKITQAGLNAAKTAGMTGYAVQITHIAFGTSQYDPTGLETALVGEKRRVTISGGGNVGPTTIQVLAEVLAISGDPFWCGEIGFFAGSTLFAIHSKAASPITYISDTISFTASYSLGLTALPAGSVTVTIDPTGNVSLSLLGAHETAVDPHPQYKDSAATILPIGTTGQLLAMNSNTRGDVKWVDLSAGISINVNTKEETQTLAASQVIVDLTTITTNGVVAYIGGGRLDRAGDFTINTPTRLTLARSYPVGTKITFAQNEVAGQVINPLDSTKNLSDVVNPATARTNIGAAAANGAVLTGITAVDGLLRVQQYSDKLSIQNATTTSTVLNVSVAPVFRVNVQANTAITFTGASAASSLVQSFELITVNDATAGRAVSFPNVNRWTGGIIPPRTTTANARDIWSFYTDDGGATWGGTLSSADEK